MVATNEEDVIDELCRQASIRLRVGHGRRYVAAVVRAVIDSYDINQVERLIVSAVAIHVQNFERSCEVILQAQSFVSMLDLEYM